MLISKLVPLAQPAEVLDIALLWLFIAKQQPRVKLSCWNTAKGNS